MELGGRVVLLGLLVCAGVAHARPPERAPRVATRMAAGAATRAAGRTVQASGTVPGEGAAQPRPRVTAVELQLPAGSDASGLAELVSVRRGQQLSPREVRRVVERLWRSGRFTDVVARTVPDGEGVRLVFVLTPRPAVVGVAVEGNQVLDDATLLAAAGFTGRGRAEAVDRLAEAERAVAAAYAVRGYDGARVRARTLPVQGGVEVLLEVEEGSVSRVSGVSFTGDPGLPLPTLMEAMGLEPGAPLDRTRVEAGLERLRALFRERRYYTAQVERAEEERTEGGVHLTIPVQAGPRFTLRFEGNRSLPSAQLEAALGYHGEEPLEAGLVQRFLRRLTDFYRYRGFHAAEVTARKAVSRDGTRATLTFVVREDHPWVVREVHFEGRKAVPAEELLALVHEQLRARTPQAPGAGVDRADPLQLEGRTGGAPSAGAPLPEAGAVFVEEAYQEAAAAMTQAYRERGFLRATVVLAQVDFDAAARSVAVRFQVEEGPRTLVADVTFAGAPADFEPARVATVAQGSPFNPAAMERGRTALERALERRGHLFADVQAEVALSGGGERAEVRYTLLPGPQVRVGKVLFEGLERTEEAQVRANLALREGEVLDPEQLFESQRNLVLLGHFRQVAVRLASPEVQEAVKDVVVEVRERPRVEGNVAFGFFLAEGPRVLVDTDVPNIGGRGYALQARGRLNYAGLSALPNAPVGVEGVGGRGNLAFLFPRLFVAPFQLGARVDAVGERTFRPNFDFTRWAGVLGADVRTLDWLTLNLQGELEHDRVEAREALLASQGYADDQRARYPVGSFTLWSARTTATADFRDDPANTHRGLLVSGTAELTRSIFMGYDQRALSPDAPGGPDRVRTVKLSGAVTGYVPLAARTVLAASVRGGSILSLRPEDQGTLESSTIPPKRFFLGGATSLRGFREDGLMPVEQRAQLQAERDACRRLASAAGCTPAATLLERGTSLLSNGGDVFALGKLELRFPLVGALDMGLFTEAGNLWLHPGNVNLRVLRYVAGAGLRYVTPVGPIVLDVGVNLAPERDLNEQAFNVHFSIGLF